jgi:hypothetical protein
VKLCPTYEKSGPGVMSPRPVGCCSGRASIEWQGCLPLLQGHQKAGLKFRPPGAPANC